MSRASNLATESGLSEDSFFRVPVLLHPHTEALATLLLPGAGNVRVTGLENAHPLWHQDRHIKDVTAQPKQQQEARMQLPRQGNGTGPAPGIWVSPPALMSLRDHARQLQQQRRTKEHHHLRQGASPGRFEVSRDVQKQQQVSPPEKLSIFNNVRSSNLADIDGSAMECEERNASGTSACASASTAKDSLQREGDGGVLVPLHLMASHFITNSGTQMETKALRDSNVGSGARDVHHADAAGAGDMQAAARQSPSGGEAQDRGTCGAAGEAGSGAIAGPVESGSDVMHGALAAAGALGPCAGSVNHSNFSPRWMLFPDAGTGTGAQPRGGGCGHGQVRPHSQHAQQQLLQQPQGPQLQVLGASRPDASSSPHPSQTSERPEAEPQQQCTSFVPGAGAAAPGHGIWRLVSAPQQQPNEQLEDAGEADGSMLIDLGPADRTAEGALMPTPERPRAVSASGSWDALRGFSLSLKARDGDDGITGGAKVQTDGVLGTLALLSPRPLEAVATGLDVAMAEPLMGSVQIREDLAEEVGANLQNAEQRKEWNSAAGIMATAAREGEDGFEADDEGEGEAGTREERARAACRLTGRSARWHPLPGLDALPPWCLLGSSAAGPPMSVPHLQGHGLDSFSSLALALPPSSVSPNTTATQVQGRQEPPSSSLPRNGSPAAPTRAVGRTATVAQLPILPLHGCLARQDAIEVDADEAILEEVLKLKCSLRRALQSQNTQATTLILSLLAAMPITHQALTDSQVTDLVSPLQYNGSAEVATAARRLTADWKGVIKAAIRGCPAARPQARVPSQQTLEDWLQPRRRVRGWHRTMSDHTSGTGTEDFNSPRHTHHQQLQHQQQMDVHVHDQASEPYTQFLPITQHSQRQHCTHTTAHNRHRFDLEGEALRSNELGTHALSLVRSQSDALAESLAAAVAVAAPAAVVVGASSCGTATAGQGPPAVSCRRGSAVSMATQTAGQRPRAGLQVRVHLTPLQPPCPQVASWETPAGAPCPGQVSRGVNWVQLSKDDSPMAAARSTHSASLSRTGSEAEVCSSGEDTQDGTRCCVPREWGLPRAGAGGAVSPAGVPGERLAGSSGCDCGSGAVLGRVLSYSPQPAPMAVSAAGSAPRCKSYWSAALCSAELNPTATAHIALASTALLAGADVECQKMPAAPPPHNTCCAAMAIASPAPCLTQPPLLPPQCAVSPPAAPSTAVAISGGGGAPAAMRPLPPSSTLVRKRKVERPSSRRRSVNPGKRQATSVVLGQLGPAGSASMYPAGLAARPGPAPIVGSGGGEATSSEQQYHPPTGGGGPVGGVKTPARSSLLGLHPPSSKRQRHHAGLGGDGGTATQVRRVSLLLSSLDLGSGGNGGEGEGEGAGAAAELAASAASARDGDADADADMGSQDDEAAMLTSSDDDLLPAVGPVGASVSCGIEDGQEPRHDKARSRGGVLGGSEMPSSAELLSLRTDFDIDDRGSGLQQLVEAATL